MGSNATSGWLEVLVIYISALISSMYVLNIVANRESPMSDHAAIYSL